MNEKTQVGAPFSDGDPYLTEYTPSAPAPASPLLPGPSIWYLDTPAERTRALEAFREETAAWIRHTLRGLFADARRRGWWMGRVQRATEKLRDRRVHRGLSASAYAAHMLQWSANLADAAESVGAHQVYITRALVELRGLVAQHDRGLP